MATIKHQLLTYIPIILVVLLLHGCGAAPTPVPVTISLQSGNGQIGPARSILPQDIVTTLSENSALVTGDTGDILIEYIITKGGGSVSEPTAVVRLPEVLGHRVQWTMGNFGENELQIKATWVSSSNAVSGSPITVKAETETVQDIDNNTYNITRIGNQDWMVGNLQTTKYNDGSSIKLITDNTEWVNTTNSAYSWYDNDESNKDPYGALYNHYTATNNKLCPAGWHVGSESDWKKLTDEAGGLSVGGKKLKEAGTTHWVDNPTATNEFLFTAIGSGDRDEAGGWFQNKDVNGGLWSSTTNVANEGIYFGFVISIDFIETQPANRKSGLAVRCVRDSL